MFHSVVCLTNRKVILLTAQGWKQIVTFRTQNVSAVVLYPISSLSLICIENRTMYRHLTILFLMLCLTLNKSAGQEQRFFYTISVESGMPHSEVVAIEEDHSGFIWFGTYNGLARYDGNTLMTITKDPDGNSHKSLRVTAILCDRKNALLYIGTEEDGLKVMDLDTYKIVERFYFANSIYSIKEGLDGEVWVGTERGIVRMTYEDASFQYRYYESTLSHVSDILQSDRNTILAAADTGIYRIDINSGHLAKILNGYSRAIYRKGNNQYMLGTSTGLFLYDSDNDNLVKLNDIDVYTIYRTSDERWWVGSIDSGLYRFSSDFSQQTYFRADDKKGLPDNGIRAFMEDFSGNLWIGTQNGASKYYTRAEIFDFYDETMNYGPDHSHKSNQTASFWEDPDGRLWIGKYHSGLKVLDRNSSEIHSFTKEQIPALHNATISSFFADEEGNLWIGTWGNLYILKSEYISKATRMKSVPLVDFSRAFGIHGKTIFKISRDRDGNFWFSTNNGLYRFRPSGEGEIKGTLDNYFSGIITTDFHIDYSEEDDTIIWLGTRHGLSKVIFRPGTTKPETVQVTGNYPDCLREGFISVIHSDSTDRLWVLGLDGYISLLTRGRRDHEEPVFKTLDINDSETSDTAESLLEDNSGNLWIGGVRMMKFNPEKWSIEYFDESDGLQNKSFKIWSSLKLSSGELVFGGVNGFSIFNPDRLQKNQIPPKIVLKDLYVSGQKINIGDKVNGHTLLEKRLDLTSRIKLSHDHNSISLSFAALHYTSPGKNRYRYMLEGYETSFHEMTGETHASYQNLPPGIYTFVLQGSNSDGIWSEDVKKLKIKISPPIWLTFPAFLLYILIVILVIYLTIKGFTQRAQNREKTRLYELKLKYFTDISHEIKTPLSLISAPIDEIYENPDLSPKVIQKLSLVKKNISRLMDLIEQIMDFNRFESDIMSLKLTQQDIISVCRNCMSYFEDKAERQDITFNFESNSTQIPVWIDRERIEKVLFNIIGNAFKFTAAGGIVIVKCQLRDKDVIVSISNNGKGILPEHLPHVFDRFYTSDENGGSGIGLALAKAIVEQHSGRIWVESERDRLTSFHFTILLGDKHFTDKSQSFKMPYETEDELSSYTVIREKNIAEDNLYKGEFSPSGKASILIAEDDRDLREYLTEALGESFSVSACSNGAEAYEIAVNSDFDCIVSDIAMPVMDGVQFCIKAKKDILLSHIPIILLTAKDSVEDKISGYNAGADDYVTKPFDLKLLITRINNLIRQRQDLKVKFHSQISIAPSMVTISSVDEQFMQRCLTFIEENINDSDYNVENLCKDLSMSRPTVYKKIKSLTGLSVVAFIRSIRMKRAAQLLLQDGSSIKNVMYMVGFDNSSYFSARFKKEFGCTPNEFVEKHKTV